MVGTASSRAETWSYFAVGSAVIALRLLLRWRAQTLRGLDVDDYLMAAVVPLQAAGAVVSYLIDASARGLANNGMTADERAALVPGSFEWRLRVRGSQLHLAGWLLYTALLWTLKLCWLFLYRRLGDRVKRMALKVNLGFVVVCSTYVAVFTTILFGCWPVARHWQINPDPGDRCYSAVSKLQAWVVVVTNLATDIYIMTIPLPMVWRAQISTAKKLGLAAMFCGGLITVGFGAARGALILLDESGSSQIATEWSSREAFAAIIVSNLPIIYPLTRQELRRLRGTVASRASRQSRSDGGTNKPSALSSGARSDPGRPWHAEGNASAYAEHGSDKSVVSLHQSGRTNSEGSAELPLTAA